MAIFARAPVAGHTKTRLIPLLGSQGAAGFQAALISDAVRKVVRLRGCVQPYLFLAEDPVPIERRHAARILHEPVENAEEMGNTCQYHYGPGGNRTLAIEYTWEGAGMTMGLARGAMKMVAGGMQTMQTLQGIGDEAYLDPGGSGLMMRKGDVMVNIDLRVAGVSIEAAEQMARTIAGRL